MRVTQRSLQNILSVTNNSRSLLNRLIFAGGNDKVMNYASDTLKATAYF